MKYYLQEMHGSFVDYRLIRMPDDIEIDESDDEINIEGHFILAHCWSVPEDAPLTKFLLPDCEDFGEKWEIGSELTSDNNTMGGHHIGKCTEISCEKAREILLLAVENTFQDIMVDTHNKCPDCGREKTDTLIINDKPIAVCPEHGI
jgi:hypothetical protein